MIIFKRKKLESRIQELEKELENYKKKEDEKNNNMHETGAHCKGCKNLIYETERHPLLGEVKIRCCKLDIKCADREE